MAPFLWMGFNCLKATEPLQGDNLLFTIHFPGIQVLIWPIYEVWKAELSLEPTGGFEYGGPELGIQRFELLL